MDIARAGHEERTSADKVTGHKQARLKCEAQEYRAGNGQAERTAQDGHRDGILVYLRMTCNREQSQVLARQAALAWRKYASTKNFLASCDRST